MHRPAAGLGQGRQRERFSSVEMQKGRRARRRRKTERTARDWNPPETATGNHGGNRQASRMSCQQN